ncbi:hypothetical protein TNCV_362331 [Trichonephila clavipes]|nr:hypothetical protein TNCV_362331 [Trichonephila clavipes]
MIVYGIRPKPRHGQQLSHNNTVLPLLPVDMQFGNRVEIETRPPQGARLWARALRRPCADIQKVERSFKVSDYVRNRDFQQRING